MKKLNNEREIFNIILESLNFEICKAIRGDSKSGGYKQSKTNFRNPSSIIDIYTKLETLLGLKLSGHTDTLTEASNLIDEFYKRGDIHNKQQYQNALDKFST